jgi:hypothetical protein
VTHDEIVTGTVRGCVGPEDVNSHQPALKEPCMSVIAVDVREETERR